MTATHINSDSDGREWFELNGADYGTHREFNSDVYGITDDGSILNADGYPLTEGDFETISVRNTLSASGVLLDD